MSNEDRDAIVRSLIGRPYEQVNCWQLVREFYLKAFHVELKQYYEGVRPDAKGVEQLIHASTDEFQKVDAPEYGDLIVFRILGIESHIAVYVGEGQFLHAHKPSDSVIERLENPKWKNRVTGYYRHLATSSVITA